VQLLIDCGIDTNICSGLGQTALDLAKKLQPSQSNAEIIRMIGMTNAGHVQVRTLPAMTASRELLVAA